MSFTLLYGREAFLQNEFIRQQKFKIFPNGENLDPNFEEFDLSQAPLSKALDFLRTAPFLAEKRLGVVRGLEELDAGEKALFGEAVKRLPASSVLIAVVSEGSVQKNAFLSLLASIGQAVPCHVPLTRTCRRG